MSHTGDNIKRIGETTGLSQQELAYRSDVTRAQISRLVNGNENNSQIQSVIALSTAPGVTLKEIIYGEQSTSNTYLTEAMSKLPDYDQKAINKFIKIWILTTQSKKMDKV